MIILTILCKYNLLHLQRIRTVVGTIVFGVNGLGFLLVGLLSC